MSIDIDHHHHRSSFFLHVYMLLQEALRHGDTGCNLLTGCSLQRGGQDVTGPADVRAVAASSTSVNETSWSSTIDEAESSDRLGSQRRMDNRTCRGIRIRTGRCLGLAARGTPDWERR